MMPFIWRTRSRIERAIQNLHWINEIPLKFFRYVMKCCCWHELDNLVYIRTAVDKNRFSEPKTKVGMEFAANIYCDAFYERKKQIFTENHVMLRLSNRLVLMLFLRYFQGIFILMNELRITFTKALHLRERIRIKLKCHAFVKKKINLLNFSSCI